MKLRPHPGPLHKWRGSGNSQIWKAMKLTFIFLTAAFLQVSANGHSQTVTFSGKNVSLLKVFAAIKSQTGYVFFYDADLIEESKPVTLDVKNMPLENALEEVFKNQPLSWSIVNKTITISRKPYQIADKKKEESLPPPPILIKGKVVNEAGEPVAGATVKIRGTNIGTNTNDNGEFSLDIPDPNMVLVISAINIEAIEVRVNAKTDLGVIKVKTAIRPLDEIVAKGYYTSTKKVNTGSVVKIKSEEIERQVISNPLAALQGRVAGLTITQQNGLPGSNYTVLLRGQNSIQNGNSPLYVIDGVPFLSDRNFLTQRSGIGASNPFATLNPNDIESIEVFKDADATAIYGSRGANGVILITTKKGVAGKTKTEFNFYKGWGKVTRTMDYLNTQQYLEMRREAFRNDGNIPDASTAPDLFLWDTTRYVDWKKLMIGGTAQTTNADIRFSGGNQSTTFSFGANYYKETTVYPGDFGIERPSVSLSVSHRSSNNKFNARIVSSYSSEKNKLISSDLSYYQVLPPNMYQPYDQNGKLIWSEGGFSYGNPFADLLKKYNVTTNRLTSNAILSYKIIPSLILKTSFGYNEISADETSINPIASQDPGSNPKGSSTFAGNRIKTWIIEPQAEYSRKLGEMGKLEIIVGASWQENIGKSNIITGNGYTNDNLLNSTIGAATITSSNGDNKYRYQAILGRIGYTWDEKYLLNLTGRRDGSSRFGPNKEYANFGAVGLGWVFSEESFIKKNISFLSYGKLRFSYGITGNDIIGDYQFLDTYSGTTYQYQAIPGLRPTRLFNPNYSWEQNRKTEAALELGVIKNRVLLNISYYTNRSDNQIVRYNLPTQTGFTNVLRNFPGIVQNSGCEIELSSTNIKSAKFEWNTAVNFSINRNKLVAFPGLESSTYSLDYIVGKPLNIIQGYHYLGIDPQTGVYQFEDVNRDNQIDNLDYKYIGTTNPVFNGGFENTIKYKGIEVNIFVQFVKQKGRHAIYASSSAPGEFTNQPVDVINRWRKPGDNAPYQRYTADFSNPAYYPATFNLATSDGMLVDASFLRLRNLSVSYLLPSSWIKKAKLENCKLYFRGQNLLTLTDYTGADPEVQNIQRLPLIKMFVIGIQLNF